MNDALVFAALVAIWFVVNRWLLPRLGVST